MGTHQPIVYPLAQFVRFEKKSQHYYYYYYYYFIIVSFFSFFLQSTSCVFSIFSESEDRGGEIAKREGGEYKGASRSRRSKEPRGQHFFPIFYFIF